MPNPITTYTTIRFIWNESKPVRDWLWNKLPFAKDQQQRQLAEQHLAALLEDAGKLSRSLGPEAVDSAIDGRIVRFREELLRDKIPADQAETLVERGALFVKLLVTGPMGEVSYLRERVAAIESELAERRAVPAAPDLRPELDRLRATQRTTTILAGVALAVAVIALIIAPAFHR